MKDHTFVPSVLSTKASEELEAAVAKELQQPNINTKSIASLLQDEEKNNTPQEKTEENI